jgi:hypothetical protein
METEQTQLGDTDAIRTDGGNMVEQTPPTVSLATLEPEAEVESGSREESAHVENIAIVPDFDEYGYVGDRGAASYTVFSGSGRSYDTDPMGNCSCMDMSMNNPENGCKHNQRLMEELTRGIIPVPDESVEEWVENTLFDRTVAAAERVAELEAAKETAEAVEEPEHDPSDYADAIDTAAAILTGLRDTYADYRERVDADAPELPEIVNQPTGDS